MLKAKLVRVQVAGRYHLNKWTCYLRGADLHFEIVYSYKKTAWVSVGEGLSEINIWEREYVFRLINRFFGKISWDRYVPALSRYMAWRLKNSAIPDILHFVCNGTALESAIRCKAGGAKIVADCIGIHHARRDELNALIAGRRGLRAAPTTPVLSERMRRELLLADVVLVPSEFAADSYRSELTNAEILVLPYGVPDHDFECKGDRSRFSGFNELRIVCTASVSRNKGQYDLLEACQAVSLAGRSVSLHLVGACIDDDIDWDSYSFPIERVAHIDNKALADFYSDKHLFCLPTYYEGMSIAQLEAVRSGLPLLTTLSSGLPTEFLSRYGVVVFEAGAINQMKGHLESFFEDPSRLAELAAKNSHVQFDRYSWSFYAQEMCNIYSRILARH